MLTKTRPQFEWEDPLLLDDQLSEEEHLVRDTARRFAQDKLMPRILEANRHERFDDPAACRETHVNHEEHQPEFHKDEASGWRHTPESRRERAQETHQDTHQQQTTGAAYTHRDGAKLERYLANHETARNAEREAHQIGLNDISFDLADPLGQTL